jgi:hypothetical protein
MKPLYFILFLAFLVLQQACTSKKAPYFEEIDLFLQKTSNLPQCPEPKEPLMWDTIHIACLDASMYKVVAGQTRCSAANSVLMDKYHKKYRWFSGIPELYRGGLVDYQTNNVAAEEVIDSLLVDNFCPCEQLKPAVYRMLAFHYRKFTSHFDREQIFLGKAAIKDSVTIELKRILPDQDTTLYNKKLDTLIQNYDLFTVYHYTIVGYRLLCDDNKKKATLISRILNPSLINKESVVYP